MIDVNVTVSVENCKGAKVKSAMLIVVAERVDTGVTETWMRRVKSSADPSSSTPDQFQAYVYAFSVMEDMFGALGLSEEDNVRILFSAKILSVSKRIFASGSAVDRGAKWTDSLENDKKNFIKFCVSVAANKALEFKKYGGTLKMEIDDAFDKNNNVAKKEFKKIAGKDSNKKFLFERREIEDRPMDLMGNLADDLEDLVGELDTSIFDKCVSAYLIDKANRQNNFRTA